MYSSRDSAYLAWARREFLVRLRLDSNSQFAIRWAETPEDAPSGREALQLCFRPSALPPSPELLRSAAEGQFRQDFIRTEYVESAIRLIVGCDVPGVTGWFLSRAEEYDESASDVHGRFPCEQSLLVREQLSHCPVVDLMVDQVAEAVLEAGRQVGVELQRVEPWPDNKRCAVCLTHDVDDCLESAIRYAFTRLVAAGYHFAGGRWAVAASRLRQFWKTLRTGIGYQWSAFQSLLDLEAEFGFRATFFALSLEEPVAREGTRHVRRYSLRNRRVQNLLRHFVEEGNEVGLHASYGAMASESLVKEEAQRLRECTTSPIRTHRHHYLRARVPETFRAYEGAGLIYDATLGWSPDTGIRAGSLLPFRMYDLSQGRELNVWECGMHMMDTSLMKGDRERRHIERFEMLMEAAKRVHGLFVLLYHPTNLIREDPRHFCDVYAEMLRRLSGDSEVWVAPVGTVMDHHVAWREGLVKSHVAETSEVFRETDGSKEV
ncbi:MAG: hypothetical protein JXL80_05310 [Planctomycetes bacterium]|nr:hypothetical protein [Planctomycetota bacterium]